MDVGEPPRLLSQTNMTSFRHVCILSPTIPKSFIMKDDISGLCTGGYRLLWRKHTCILSEVKMLLLRSKSSERKEPTRFWNHDCFITIAWYNKVYWGLYSIRLGWEIVFLTVIFNEDWRKLPTHFRAFSSFIINDTATCK